MILKVFFLILTLTNFTFGATELETLNPMLSGKQWPMLEEAARKMIGENPKSNYRAEIENYLGLALVGQKKFSDASQYFKSAIEHNARPAFVQSVMFNLGASLYDEGKIQEAYDTLKAIQIEILARDVKAKTLSLRLQISRSLFDLKDSIREHFELEPLFTVQSDADALQGPIEGLVRKMEDHDWLEKFANEFAQSRFHPILIAALRSTNNPASSETNVNSSTDHVSAAGVQQDGAQNEEGSIDGNAIGILIPLSGKFSKQGEKTLRAIELALSLQSNTDTAFSLRVEDAGESVESALAALDRLVNRRHVVAVLGPISSKGFDQVLKRSQELMVPLFSLVQNPGENVNPNHFSLGVTVEAQIRRMLEVATSKFGIKSFAVVSPKSSLGETYTKTFFDECRKWDVQIKAFETYEPEATDFRPLISKMTGTSFVDARKRETSELAKIRENLNVTRKTRKTEQYFNLSPVKDFDAIFIADDVKNSSLLIPTFAYQDVSGVRFFGISAWNNADFLARLGSSQGVTSDPVFFVDAVDNKATIPSVAKVASDFLSMFNESITSTEVVAYDAVQFLVKVLKGANAGSRQEIFELLADKNVDFNGVGGSIKMSNNQVVRQFPVFSVKKNKIEVF